LVGRRQAFALVAGRCSAADAEILFEIREKKLFRAMEATWEDFCSKRIGVTRSYVDRIIRQYRELGAAFCKLNSFARIKAAEYRVIVGARYAKTAWRTPARSFPWKRGTRPD